MFEIDSALRTLVERGGSDLHVKVAAPPTIRLHGELVPLEGYEALSADETEKAFHGSAETRSLTECEQEGEVDFSYAISGLSRFRVNVFKQRGSTSIVCRAISFEIRSVEALGLPPPPPPTAPPPASPSTSSNRGARPRSSAGRFPSRPARSRSSASPPS